MTAATTTRDATSVRRVVVVTRRTVLAELLDRHGTRGQVEWVLRDRGGASLGDLDAADAAHRAAVHAVTSDVPLSWRRAHVDRDDLDRFLFEPDDVVVAIGPDGLVANVAKYVDGQPVIGVDAEDGRSVGRLSIAPADDVGRLLRRVDAGGDLLLQPLTMVEAVLDDGRRLRALNEVFVGHRSHQSARYTLQVGDRVEQQSSSGLIAATGTGATGWAASIHRATRCDLPLPAPEDPRLLLLVREAWPSAITGADLVAAAVEAGVPCSVTSAMDDGTVFGDGIERDPLPFEHGRTVLLRPAEQRLHLVQG